MLTLPSTEGVDVALYDFGGSPTTSPLLIAHATGFHAHCYTPMARLLSERFHVSALDFRGHGATPVHPEWQVDWRRFGDDALVAARHVAPSAGLIGFGHSMGGAALLMAAHREPGLFERLVLFEPISHQATASAPTAEEMWDIPIVQGALRRRPLFPSLDDAHENYATKPPLSSMVPEALRNYVDHGFEPTIDDFGQPAVQLRCRPVIEASIFVTGRDNGVWHLLPEIETPCVVIGGRVDENQPSAQTESIADRLPNGRYVRLDDQTHFGPFSHPTDVVRVITETM